MLWKNKSSLGIVVILLAIAGLLLGSTSTVAQVTLDRTLTLISLDVRWMDLQDVLRLIAEKADVNIIAVREVAEADVVVTLRLKNVDLWQALEAVLEVSGFGYREEDGIIRVVKLEELIKVKPPLITEIILLKYSKVEKIKKVCQALVSSSGTIKMDIQTNALIITDIPQNIERIRQVVTELDTKPPPVLERKQFQLNYIVDAAEKEEKDLLKDILDNIIGEEGNFFIDSLTNSVYVEAPSSRIKMVKEYFEGADVSPKRIMIKAEFVEIQIGAEEELGIKWRWKGAYENYPLGATFGYPYYARPEPGEEVPGSRTPLSTLAAGMGIIFGSTEQEFRGIIDLLISEGKAHLISSPNIVTLEGEEAEIDVGDEYPYRVSKFVEGTWVYDIEFVTVGATLLVTPYIKEEKRIVLDIQSKVSEITGAPPFETAPPIVGTRKVKTQIAVNAGETIVMGGLLRETEKETRAGVPFLSDIPILGSLFSHKTVTKTKSDLLIFITPYILSEEIEEENILEKRKPLRVQIEEFYQKGLDYKKNGEYEKARKYFEEVTKKSRIYAFSDYLESAEKELVEVERLEKKKLEKEKREKERLEQKKLKEEKREAEEKAKLEKGSLGKETFLAIALGEWFPCSGTNSFMIYEAQIRLKENLMLFGGSGQSSDNSLRIGYFGIRTGDKFNVGVGGMGSNVGQRIELLLTAGFSLGTGRVRLAGNYFYVPESQDANGIKALLAIRF